MKVIKMSDFKHEQTLNLLDQITVSVINKHTNKSHSTTQGQLARISKDPKAVLELDPDFLVAVLTNYLSRD